VADLIEYSEAPATAATAVAASGRAAEQLQTLLIEGEQVRAFALQHRLYALLHRRHLGAATTGRFIFLRRTLFGGYEPVDVRWQDLKDARVTVGMFSATLTLRYSANLSDTASREGEQRVLTVSGLEKEAAQALYRACQTQEQSWREKRRVRSIEEMRAAAGGIQIATGVYPAASPEPALEHHGPSTDDPAQRLANVRKMLEQGLITDSEFEAIKARIVAAL
jgi:hypothetical protein